MPIKKPESLFGKELSTVCTDGMLLVVSIDALSDTPSTETLEELMKKFSFFNPYKVPKNKSKSNPDVCFAKNPRQPGDIQFWVSKTRNNQNITICSLVTHILHGPSVPQRDYSKYRNITVDQSDLLREDITENRCKWFKEALNKLSSSIRHQRP